METNKNNEQVKGNAEKTNKAEKPVVVSGTKLENGDIAVNKSDVVKLKATKAATYGQEKWHHMVKLGNGKSLVFVWDSREIVAVCDTDSIVAEDINKHVKDSGSALHITANTPKEAIEAIESLKK